MKKLVILSILTLLCISSAFAADNVIVDETVKVETFNTGSFSGEISSYNEMSTLNDSITSEIYSRFLESINDEQTTIDLADLNIEYNSETKELISKTYEKVINDNPEFFYVSNEFSINSYENGNVKSISPVYNDLISTRVTVDEKANQIIAQYIDSSMSELEKALALHDYIVLNVVYNWDVATTGVLPGYNDNVYNPYGALIEGDAVCQGYAEAYELLLQKCGIQSVLVPSSAMNHVWNAVKIDGNWYHVDTTWDDPVPNLNGYCKYDNFLRSDDGITNASTSKHHSWSMPSGINISTSDYSGIFRNTGSVIYNYNDNYYYFSEGWDKTLYKAQSLTDQNPVIITENLPFFNYYTPLIWIDDCVYFMGRADNTYTNNKLFCYNFINDVLYTGASIEYTKSPSYDNHYTENYDGIGLEYKNGKIVATSRTRPSLTLGTLNLVSYPNEWNASENTQIVGVNWLDSDTVQIGLSYKQGSLSEWGNSLLFTIYDGYKMVSSENILPPILNDGLNIFEYSVSTANYDQIKIFLFDKLYDLSLIDYVSTEKS